MAATTHNIKELIINKRVLGKSMTHSYAMRYSTSSFTIEERFRQAGGRSSGFDYLRLGLAISVVSIHTTGVSYGRLADLAIWRWPQSAFDHLILPMFFALSGFLVAGSLERCPTLVSFFGLRVLRIVPALAVEVLLSAIIFGPALSKLNAQTYFSSPELYSYFLNIIGDIHYFLPGVFSQNPMPDVVNAQLWTVPFELQCYAALGGLAAIGIVKSRGLLLCIAIFGQGLWIEEALKRGSAGASNGASGPLLILCFLVGVLFFLYRDKIAYSATLFMLSIAACIALLYLPHGTYYVPIPATYVTVYIGLLNPSRLPFVFGGDYSYGIYLYGFPVQQAFASLGAWTHHWFLNLLVSLPIAFLIAYCSWNIVEKPTLGFRRFIPAIERRLVRLACRLDISGLPERSRRGRARIEKVGA